MAIIPINGSSFTLVVGSASNIYALANHNPGIVSPGGVLIQIVATTLTGSISVVARAGMKEAIDDAVAFVAWPYRSFFLNGAAADGSLAAGSSGVAITNTSILLVPADGVQIGLSVTALTVGSAKVYWQPLFGSTAP